MSTGRTGQRSSRRRKGSRLKRVAPIEVSSSGTPEPTSSEETSVSEQAFSPLRQRRLSDAVLCGYEEEDNDDDSSIETSSCQHALSATIAPQHEDTRQLSTTELLEESHLQVDFCEMTVAEMNQILDWWSSKPSSLVDDKEAVEHVISPDCQAPQNSLTLPDNQDDEQETDCLLEDSFVFETPSKSTVALGLWNTNTSLEDFEGEPISPLPHGSPSNLLMDQPLPQNVAFFSPIQAWSFQSPPPSTTRNDKNVEPHHLESPSILEHSFGTFSNAEDVHTSAQKQHAEVKRLLFQTQDMVDMVASLTETSGTDEDYHDKHLKDDDNDDDDSSTTSGFQEKRSPQLNPPRNAGSILRRRARGKKAQNTAILPSNSQDSNSSLLELYLQDHCYLWLRRVMMKLETTIVSRCLVPVLPLPFLLYLMHRPRVFRCLLWATLFIQMVSVPLLTWRCLPRRVVAPVNVQSALNLFSQHPYFTSELHYTLQVTHHPYATTTAISFDEGLFCEGGFDRVLL